MRVTRLHGRRRNLWATLADWDAGHRVCAIRLYSHNLLSRCCVCTAMHSRAHCYAQPLPATRHRSTAHSEADLEQTCTAALALSAGSDDDDDDLDAGALLEREMTAIASQAAPAPQPRAHRAWVCQAEAEQACA
eukprot:2002907-Rhodomonas_salina.3